MANDYKHKIDKHMSEVTHVDQYLMCVCVCVYIYIYRQRERERERA